LSGCEEPFKWKDIRCDGKIEFGTSISIQLRSGKNPEDIMTRDFIGPDGTNSTFYYFPQGIINIQHNGDQYIQYQLYFETLNRTITPIIENVMITYNGLPRIELSTPDDIQNGDITIDYYLFDNDNDTVDLEVEFSTDGNSYYTATYSDEGDGISQVSSSCFGMHHRFVWDSKTDILGVDSDDVQIRITPSDLDRGITETTNTFSIDNKEPILNVLTTSGLINHTTTELIVETDENAFLKWSSSNASYQLMENYFSNGQGAMHHSTLINLSEGENSIFIGAADELGNSMEFGKQILYTLDSIAPIQSSVIINNGTMVINSTSVTLDIYADDSDGSSLDEMMLGNHYPFSEREWENFSYSKQWNLEKGDGLKTVYLVVKDKVGNIADLVFDTILLDSKPPVITSIDILSNRDSMNVSLYVKTDENATLRYSTDNIGYFSMINGFSAGKGTTNHSTIINCSSGLNTIFVCAMDSYGNVMGIGEKITFNIFPQEKNGTIDDNNDNDDYDDNDDEAVDDNYDEADNDNDDMDDGDTNKKPKTRSSQFPLGIVISTIILALIIGAVLFIILFKKKHVDTEEKTEEKSPPFVVRK